MTDLEIAKATKHCKLQCWWGNRKWNENADLLGKWNKLAVSCFVVSLIFAQFLNSAQITIMNRIKVVLLRVQTSLITSYFFTIISKHLYTHPCHSVTLHTNKTIPIITDYVVYKRLISILWNYLGFFNVLSDSLIKQSKLSGEDGLKLHFS